MHKENLVSLFYKRVDLINRLKKEKKEKKKNNQVWSVRFDYLYDPNEYESVRVRVELKWVFILIIHTCPKVAPIFYMPMSFPFAHLYDGLASCHAIGRNRGREDFSEPSPETLFCTPCHN